MLQALLIVDKLLLFVVVIWAAVVDARVWRIPNALVACGAVGKLLLMVGEGLLAGDGVAALGRSLGLALLSALGVLLFMLLATLLLRKGAADDDSPIGGGDIKLMCTVALWFDFTAALTILALACVIALVVALIRSRGQLRLLGGFPFAPYIAIATAVVFLGPLL